jgi:hypothetical protein
MPVVCLMTSVCAQIEIQGEARCSAPAPAEAGLLPLPGALASAFPTERSPSRPLPPLPLRRLERRSDAQLSGALWPHVPALLVAGDALRRELLEDVRALSGRRLLIGACDASFC